MTEQEQIDAICKILEDCDGFSDCAKVVFQAAHSMGLDYLSLKEHLEEYKLMMLSAERRSAEVNVDKGILKPEALDRFK